MKRHREVQSGPFPLTYMVEAAFYVFIGGPEYSCSLALGQGSVDAFDRGSNVRTGTFEGTTHTCVRGDVAIGVAQARRGWFRMTTP